VDKSSPDYCPVVTVAGSYPGFLSAMLRVMHPDIIDIAYATSAPIYLYGHEHADEVYYDYVTKIADAAVPDCAAAVKEAIVEFHDWAVDPKTGSMHEKARDVKIWIFGGLKSMRLSRLISPKPTWDTILRAQTQNLKRLAVSS
jgi:Serine carboxypeptidase S28